MKTLKFSLLGFILVSFVAVSLGETLYCAVDLTTKCNKDIAGWCDARCKGLLGNDVKFTRCQQGLPYAGDVLYCRCFVLCNKKT
ncbi:hypothetical protein ACP275_12G117700 [Erythranthe tilingii]